MKKKQNKRVICDTMIWYHFAEGKLNIQDYSDYNLVATWVNIIELAHAHPSKNKKYDINTIRNASKMILDYATDIIELDFFEFQTEILFPSDFDFNHRDFREVLTTLSELKEPISLSEFEKLNTEYYDMVKQTFVDNTSNYILKERNIYKELTKKEKFDYKIGKWDLSIYEYRCGEVFIELNNFFDREFDKQIDFTNKADFLNSTKELSRFNFYIYTKMEFMKHLTKTEGKVKKNDFGDLINTIYVGENDLYFTDEKKWNYIFSQNKNLKLQIIKEPNKQ